MKPSPVTGSTVRPPDAAGPIAARRIRWASDVVAKLWPGRRLVGSTSSVSPARWVGPRELEPRTCGLRVRWRPFRHYTETCRDLRFRSGRKWPNVLPAGTIRPRFAPSERLAELGHGCRGCVLVGVDVGFPGGGQGELG